MYLIRKCVYGLFLVFVLLMWHGCEKVILSGEGELLTVSEEYDVFEGITFYDIFHVRLLSDSVFSVALKVHEKYRDNVSFILDSGVISFYDKNPERWLPEYPWPVVEIRFPRLDGKLFLESPVWITTPDTLRVPRLNLLSLGKTGDFNITMETESFQFVTGSDNSGMYTFQGSAESARIWPRGSSQVNAANLRMQRCNVYSNSIGDCSVYVTGRLEVRLNTMGDVVYYGDPDEVMLVEESGEGRLIKAD